MELSDTEFKRFSSFIYDAFGIDLPPAKKTMLSARLRGLIEEQGFSTFNDFYDGRLLRPTSETLDSLINRVSTNHTYFNRESAHFDYMLNTALPTIRRTVEAARGPKELRVWCAAASRGQEPYTLGMVLYEFFGVTYGAWSTGVLATDLSDTALKIARAGVYAAEEVEPLPSRRRKQFLTQRPDGDFEITEQLKREITFRRLNLICKAFPFKKPFHLIFCRNVMIYFDRPTRDALVERLVNSMADGGYLFVGLAESLGNSNARLESATPGVYRRIS